MPVYSTTKQQPPSKPGKTQDYVYEIFGDACAKAFPGINPPDIFAMKTDCVFAQSMLSKTFCLNRMTKELKMSWQGGYYGKYNALNWGLVAFSFLYEDSLTLVGLVWERAPSSKSDGLNVAGCFSMVWHNDMFHKYNILDVKNVIKSGYNGMSEDLRAITTNYHDYTFSLSAVPTFTYKQTYMNVGSSELVELLRNVLTKQVDETKEKAERSLRSLERLTEEINVLTQNHENALRANSETERLISKLFENS